MATATRTRWFEPDRVAEAARSLMAEVGQACDAIRPPKTSSRYSERQLALLNTRTILFLAAVVGFIGAVLFNPNLLPGDWLAKDDNLQSVVKWIVAIVPIGCAVAARNRLRRAAQRTDVHDSCIETLTRQLPDLRDARLTPVTGPSVNVLPRLATDCRPLQRCSLFGEYRSHALAMFEVEYTAPTMLDAKQVFDRAQARVLRDPDQEQFSRMRTAEAIVFFRPQPQLPDLFLAGTEEPMSRYQAGWVKQAGARPGAARVRTPFGSTLDAFSSCPLSAAELFSSQLTELLVLRPNCLIQVIGGFVVVVPRSWGSATPMDTATAAFEIQLDLDFACAVYDALAAASADAVNERDASQSHIARQQPPIVC